MAHRVGTTGTDPSNVSNANGGTWNAFTGGPFGVGPKFQFYWSIYQTGQGNPTVNNNSGGAQSTVIAQIAAFSGTHATTPIDVIGSVLSSTGSDIGPIPAITPGYADGAVVVFGDRSDDWTSVATLSGDSLTWNEIGEPDSTSGADGGMVWDYALYSAIPTLTDKTFTVTGGLSDITHGLMFSIRPPDVAFTGIPYLVTARRN